MYLISHSNLNSYLTTELWHRVQTTPDGRRITFSDEQGDRKSIRLGKVSQSTAQIVRGFIEDIAESRRHGISPDPSTRRWLKKLDGRMRSKLARVGLIRSGERKKRKPEILCEFMDRYIEMKSKTLAPVSIEIHKKARRNLVDFFSEDKLLRDDTEGDAVDFREFLVGEKGYAESTVRKRCAKGSE